MANVLTESVKIGNFRVPMGLLLLVGAALLAVVALSQKSKGGSNENANALIGQYDPAQEESAASVSAPPSYALPPAASQGVQTSIVGVPKLPTVAVNQPTLIDINTAVANYPAAKTLVEEFANAFRSSGGVEGVKATYAWYDRTKNVLIDDATKTRFYG